MKNIIKFIVFLLPLAACDDLFEPAPENIRDVNSMYQEPTYADGILGDAYILLPYSSAPTSDVATDDAVTNDRNDNYLKITTGSWAADNDPLSQWKNRRAAIQYLNLFLENADMVIWSKDENLCAVYNDRMKGEAYGLRALQMLYLLQAHGGWTSEGRLLGVPNLTASENTFSDFNQPRSTFQECVQQIMDDAEMAIELLPLDYADLKSDDDVPAKYKSTGVSANAYNRANGDIARGRLTGRIVEAIRVQAALLAASPAFADGTEIGWADVADYAAIVLDRINGVNGLSPEGLAWYTKEQVDNLSSGANPAEIIWRGTIETNNDLEASNFPPSLRGTGRINPTQNLVDAFPALNGYPISDNLANYDAVHPYDNRDPRLAAYILVNGGKQGTDNTEIITGTYGTNNDALDRENGYSTRTGYYLRKLLRSDCNPHPDFNTKQKHYTKRIRYTEIFLAYAEAANEAWGPTGTGTHGYSAYDVIKAIRKRAGIGLDNGDAYLESVKTDQDKMRQLIRNERRLELCFENIRFWDLRRWKVSLNETAKGMQINQAEGGLSYSPINVETRNYKDYMYYGPVPYEEMLKWNNLEQNKGW